MTPDRFREFKPAGPVAAAFMADTVSDVRALMGPVGGGKTVTCIFDSLKNASMMPVCIDNEIHYKIAVIGNTYGQLERNLFPTWTTWLPKDGGNWTNAEFTGGGGRFAIHNIGFKIERGNQIITVRFEAIFAAIGEYSVEQFMRGFEPTAFWLFEMDLSPPDVLPQAIFRLGRHPPVMMLPPSTPLRGFPGHTLGNLPPGYTYEKLPANSLYRSYVIGDLNAPDIDSWFYQEFEEDLRAGYKLYRQPSGRSPRAENLHNLPPGYYDRQVAMLKKPNLIKRYVDAQYGPSSDGKPVYEDDYSDDVHWSREPLKLAARLPIKFGFDQGLRRPACAITQRLPNGQMRPLAEVVPGRAGPRRFAEAVKLELASLMEFSGLGRHQLDDFMGWADPAGFYGADKEDGEMAWAEIVAAELGFPILPAPSNEISLRLEAVRDDLTYAIDGNTRGLLISSRCKVLRKGFASHYRYAIQRVAGRPNTSPKPVKDEYADVHDALQYVALGDKGRYGVIAGAKAVKAARPPAAWRPAARWSGTPRGSSARRSIWPIHGSKDLNCRLISRST